jgi:hypothetical protein
MSKGGKIQEAILRAAAVDKIDLRAEGWQQADR